MPAPAAAVLLGHDQAEQPRVAEHLEQILRILGGRVDLAGPGRDLVLRELADAGLQFRVLRCKIEHRAGSLSRGLSVWTDSRDDGRTGGREEARVATTKDRDGDAVDVTSRTVVLEGDDIVVIPDEPETQISRAPAHRA